MITGKVTDKATKAPIPGVYIVLSDSGGDCIKNNEGVVVETQTDKAGNYEVEMGPGQYLQFNMPGYPIVSRSYEDAIRRPNVDMDDGSGTALSLTEVKTFMKDTAKQVNGKWLIGVGIGIFLLLLVAVVGKKNGWF